MGRNILTIGFDADDTLWHNESFFQLTQDRFAALLADYAEDSQLRAHLTEAERRNLGAYGFGIKGFVLSMIETAIEVTEGRVPSSVIAEILDAGKEMLAHPIELLDYAEETVRALSGSHRLVLITKGDLLDQERKLAQSGLGDFFHAVEIVSDKTPATYAGAFARHGSGAETAMMVGNSLKSDVIPALEAGAWAVHVPHDLTWDYERAEAPVDHPRFREAAHLGEVPALLD
ncbi:HAD family hydrolase [Rhodobacterales bacterium HKCCE2091]|nr:HAD family hydrolase [Rhodobacterales bacterium HKCCE2091]